MLDLDKSPGIYTRTIPFGTEYLGTKKALMEALLVGPEPLPGQRGARTQHSSTISHDGVRLTIRRKGAARWAVAIEVSYE